MAAERPTFDPDRPTFDPDRIAVPDEAPAAPRLMTVTQLNAMIKRVLGDRLPGTIHLLGQIRDLTRPSSGHLYLTLKDDRSEIRALMWRSGAMSLKFELTDGLEVIATGHVDMYEPRGQVQFYIRRLEPRGVGALELAFRQLQDRLAREGLFDRARKRPLPRLPRCIAVVTSSTGAVIHDILTTLRRRFPCLRLLLHPVRVQGEGAAAEIAAAIGRLNHQAASLGGIDLMIVARGGGSLEDLWPFNEEVVARAIYASAIPVVTGIGHEVDVTIADLVADVRAATPTAAAELAVPVLDEVLELLAAHAARLHRALRQHVNLARARLDATARAEWFRDPLVLVRRSEQRLDEVSSRLRLSGAGMLARVRQRLHECEIALAAVQPGVLLKYHRSRLAETGRRMLLALHQHLRFAERRLGQARHALALAGPAHRIAAGGDQVGQWARQLDGATAHRIQLARHSIDALEARLEGLSYRRTLARGFTITRRRRDRGLITRAIDVHAGDRIVTETAEGEFESRVSDSRQGELFD